MQMTTSRIVLGSDSVLLQRTILWQKSELRIEAGSTENIYMAGRSRAVLDVCVLHRGKVIVVERGLSEADAEHLSEVLSISLVVEKAHEPA